jgi:hypothetical protein
MIRVRVGENNEGDLAGIATDRSDIVKDCNLATCYTRIDEGDCLACQKVRLHETVDSDAGCNGDFERMPECVDGRSDLHCQVLLSGYELFVCSGL